MVNMIDNVLSGVEVSFFVDVGELVGVFVVRPVVWVVFVEFIDVVVVVVIIVVFVVYAVSICVIVIVVLVFFISVVCGARS